MEEFACYICSLSYNYTVVPEVFGQFMHTNVWISFQNIKNAFSESFRIKFFILFNHIFFWELSK